MKTLEQLKKEYLVDAIIEVAEVNELKAFLYAEGIIAAQESKFLSELNNSVTENQNYSTFYDLFIEAISSYLLKDGVTSYKIDDADAKYSCEKAKDDFHVDEVENIMPLNLKAKTKSFPSKLELLVLY